MVTRSSSQNSPPSSSSSVSMSTSVLLRKGGVRLFCVSPSSEILRELSSAETKSESSSDSTLQFDAVSGGGARGVGGATGRSKTCQMNENDESVL
eukprot:CAMPEP_0176000346 /NCGR_PEP_ID=MMETSP0108-20121206/57773_1 /TAXON_ID=195067 ORGANISM="Goniomonas pacifica, Strain CCMP1869" /NCGR_SAMPLE_ID=MMETSP0108 /ASSEMBLY_ACC=CAM_ASM_000204 /LENGTH=94 /DNA_ID=CAMNT_0017332843 /DNA_START=138 /DNA_END=422 /DNA_ORIENTATION=+